MATGVAVALKRGQYFAHLCQSFVRRFWYAYLCMCINAAVSAPVSTIVLSHVASRFASNVQNGSKAAKSFAAVCGVYAASLATQAARELIPDALLQKAVAFFTVELYDRALDAFENQDGISDASVADMLYTIRLVASRASELCVYFVSEYIYLCAYLLTYSIYLFTLDVQYGLICFAFISLMVLVSVPLIGMLCVRYVAYLSSERHAMTVAESSLANAFVVVAMSARQDARETMRGAAQGIQEKGRRYMSTQIILFTAWYAIICAFFVVGMYVIWRSRRIPKSALNSIVFSLVLVLNYIASTSDRMKRNAWRFAAVFDDVAARMFNETDETRRQRGMPPMSVPSGGVMSVDRLSFAYPGKHPTAASPTAMVLTDVCLRVRKGELVVLKGRSGSGKSTLLKLCAHLLRPSRGRITLAGVCMQDVKAQDWRKHVLYVSQKLSVFKGTVFNNIVFGTGVSNVSKEELRAYLDRNAITIMNDLDADVGALATTNGEGFLSGGMSKIVVIVRAALRCMDDATVLRHFPNSTRTTPPPVVVLFDEPLAGLDPRSCASVKRLIQRGFRDISKLCVAHSDDLDDVATHVIHLQQNQHHQQNQQNQHHQQSQRR